MRTRTFRGQSLIECVMVLPLFIAFWAAMVWFAQGLILEMQLLQTARHGVFWLAYNPDLKVKPREEREQVQQECIRYLKRRNPHIDLHKLQLQIEVGDRWQPIGPRKLSEVSKIINLMSRLPRLFRDAAGLKPFAPARIRLEYVMGVSPLLRAIPGFPTSITLRGSSVCYR